MKSVLIMVLSSELPHYDKLMEVSMSTWDSISVEGVDAFYYSGKSTKASNERVLYTNVEDHLFSMGYKDLEAFEYVLKNKQFDYIARVNSSCYVDKKRLFEHVQTLPDTNVFAGCEVTAEPKWMAGMGQFLMSKDVFENIVFNQADWDHKQIEDVAMSQLVDRLGIPYTEGKACSINKTEAGYLCLLYGGGESFESVDLKEFNPLSHFFFRIKTEGDRPHDFVLMEMLFNVFNNKMDKIRQLVAHVAMCFEKAERLDSKIPQYIKEMEGMSSEKTRHFYNNLLSIPDVRYLEIGTWKGSSSCSAMYGNKADVVLIDNFSEFGVVRDEFMENFNKFKGGNNAVFIEQDCFEVDIAQFGSNKFNIYLYDGNHTEESQFKAIDYYLPCLDDEFIYVVDDWNEEMIRTGTKRAFEKNGLEIVWNREILYDWHNGIGVFILRKPNIVN